MWIFIGFGMALLGFGLLVSGLKGQWVSLWHVIKPLGIGIAIALIVFLIGYSIGPWAGMPWTFAGLGFLFLGYGVTVLYILFSPENTKGGAQLSMQYRAASMVLGFVLMVAFPVGTQYEKIATWLCKRAVQQGERSHLAEIIDSRVRPWNSLRGLAPSPQREQLITMIASRSSSKTFWETLLSLPPSPERLEVIKTFGRE